MVVEGDVLSFAEWFPDALRSYLLIVLSAAGAMLAISWLVTALRHGPITALKIVGSVLGAGVADLAVGLGVLCVAPLMVLALSIRALPQLFAPFFRRRERLAVEVVRGIAGRAAAAFQGGVLAGSEWFGKQLPKSAVNFCTPLTGSVRRVWALGWLAVKESIRHRVVVVFGVLMLILLFAGWFLDPGSNEPARLYLSFVLTATSYLVLGMALFLSALSLPADIKSKTLQTVVTKPVRPGEIVLGRMLGFTAVGTLLLTIMGTISYVFVVRGLAHRHELEPDELARAEKILSRKLAAGQQTGVLEIETTKVHNHRHEIRIDPFVRTPGSSKAKPELKQSGTLLTGTEQGHQHELSYRIIADKEDKRPKAQIVCELGSPRGGLVARVPIYGRLRFKNRAGQDTNKSVKMRLIQTEIDAEVPATDRGQAIKTKSGCMDQHNLCPGRAIFSPKLLLQ